MKLFLSCTVAALFLGTLVGNVFCAAIAFPSPTTNSLPQPTPVSPDGWDFFSPPIDSILPSSAAPTIAEWTHTGGPDDTLILTGDKLSSFSGDDEGRDTQFLFYGQTVQADSVKSAGSIRRLDGSKAAVTLPLNLPLWSTYFLWPKNSAGYGYPIAVNATDAWWLNPDDRVTQGETVSVYGRNLSHDGGTVSSWVYLKPSGVATTGEWAAVTSVNPYRIQFTVPSTLANGVYEVWVHNGHGGDYGWSGPLSLTVGDRYEWNGTTFSVKDYGATGDGVTDDTQAILAAYSDALAYRDRSGVPAKLHPTLYFPAGIYQMNQGLSLKHDMRFTGDGKTLTILRCSANFRHTSSQGLMYGERDAEQDIEVSNLTLDANGNFAETSFPYDYLVCCTFVQQWTDIHFSNVRLQVSNPGNRTSAMCFGTINRLTLSGCELVGGDIMLMGTTHASIDRCTFSFANDLFTGIYFQSVNGVSVTQCSCADRDINSDTGQGLGRFVILGGYLGSQRNVYIGDNKTVDCAPRVGAQDQNTGEQILSEGNVVRYEGHPAVATHTTATFATLTPDQNQRVFQTAVIVAGKGLGQTRPITATDYANKTITVSPAWNVTPDSTSAVQIAWTTDRCVIYHNSFDGKNDYGTRVTASCAIEPYGGCNEWIADSNTITNMHYAIYVAGLAQYAPEPVAATEPCLFHYYANNSIRECYRGSFNFADTPMDAQSVPLDSTARVGYLGQVFRGNQWSDITNCAVCFDGAIAGSSLDMTVYEHNTFTNLPQGIDFFSNGHHSQALNPVLYKNTFARGTAANEGSFGARFISSTLSPVLQDNAWSGFENAYTGAEMKGFPNIPIRTFELQTTAAGAAATATILILNTGTTPLIWTASSDSSWLAMSASSGTVPDERSASPLVVTCDAIALLPGTHDAIVTIANGSIMQKVSVSFTVSSSMTPPKQVAISMTIIPPPSGLSTATQ